MMTATDGHRAAPGAVSDAAGDDPTNWPTYQEFISLLEELDLATIADQFDIGTHTTIQDFEQHLKVAIFEGLDPSDSLASLAQQTASHDGVDFMAASTFSELTNALLHWPRCPSDRYRRTRMAVRPKNCVTRHPSAPEDSHLRRSPPGWSSYSLRLTPNSVSNISLTARIVLFPDYTGVTHRRASARTGRPRVPSDPGRPRVSMRSRAAGVRPRSGPAVARPPGPARQPRPGTRGRRR